MQNPNEENTNKKTENESLDGKKEEKEVSKWKKGWRKELIDWIEAIAVAVVCALLLKNYVMTLAVVDGASMESTLSHGDRLYVNRVMYTPKKGDIVIINTDKHPQGPIVKRVIATEGDTIYIDPETYLVYVNDELIEEDYIKGKTVLPVIRDSYGITRGYTGELSKIYSENYSRENPIVVGDGEVFAMGDNRENSSDSRNLGLFSKDEILGHVLFRFWPLNDLGKVD